MTTRRSASIRPSNEGFGLPVVEAFSRGNAVISSNGGTLAEVAEGLSPCLSATDDDAWHTMFAQWIIDPAARMPYETAIRTRFHRTTWQEATELIFQAVGGDHSRGPP